MPGPAHQNLAVVVGELSSPPEVRLLDSGSRLASLALRVKADAGPATSVPVTVWDPPPAVEGLAEGDLVCVLGRVERRFFRRASGGTGSAVAVVAHDVVAAGDGRRAGAWRRRVRAALGPAER